MLLGLEVCRFGLQLAGIIFLELVEDACFGAIVLRGERRAVNEDEVIEDGDFEVVDSGAVEFIEIEELNALILGAWVRSVYFGT